MKLYSSILICLLVGNYPSSAHIFGMRNFRLMNSRLFTNDVTNDMMPIEKFNQKLDHFDPTNNITWEQRYGVDTSFFKSGSSSPVFLMVSGEGKANFLRSSGAWSKYAEKYGALCLELEHRYYGGSHPTKDMSTENLKFLSSQQALADLAYFIEGMNKKYGLTNKNKWIAFGGSYAGSLAAWLRYKYPHLVHGAVSSSAPLLAKADFYEYMGVVKSSLDTYGHNCSGVVTEVFNQLQELLKTDAGRENIRKLFQLCDKIDIQNKKDIKSLFSMLSDDVAYTVQNNEFFKKLSSRKGIDFACDILTNQTLGRPLVRYAIFNNFMRLANQERKCKSFKYSDYVKRLQNVAWDEARNERQWIYQTCTEFGFYQTSEKTSIFGSVFDLKFSEDACTDIYGPRFNGQLLDSGIYRTNTIYGGLNIKATRVVYVHGSLDPWHVLGITHSTNEQAPAIFINGTAHCTNMNNESPFDLPQLKEARVKISALIGKWLNKQ